MKIYKYRNYDHYKEKQVAANKQKFHCTWLRPATVEHIQKFIPDAKKIICHGVRNGQELHMFNNVYTPEHIVGTDIAPSVLILKDTFEVYEHDFHDDLVQYTDYFDLVYTNCLDHAYAPRIVLKAFDKQLAKGGHLVVELMIGDNNISCEMDPLEISVDEYKKIILDIGHEIVTQWTVNYTHGSSTIVVSKK